MKNGKDNSRRLWYGGAALVFVLGCLIAGAAAILAAVAEVPVLVDVFSERLQRVAIPGETDLLLRREGAYAIYYQSAYWPAERPPSVDCSLTASATGKPVAIADDFVPRNADLQVNGQHVGALMYSVTIDTPGSYRLACQAPAGNANSHAILAVGPNYVWEMLHAAWIVVRSLLGGLVLVLGSALLALLIAVAALLRSQSRRRAAIAAA